MPFPTTLNITGASIKAIKFRSEVIVKDLGSGYFRSARVGPASGLHGFMLQMNMLPTVTTHTGTIASKNWFKYYYDFFIDQATTSTPSFLISWDSKLWHVRFAETETDFERFKGDIYGHGVELKPVRLAGVTYAADGSYTSGP